MKAAKKRRSRIVPRAIFATVCIGVVPEIASCGWASVAAACFTDAGSPGPCGEDFLPTDAGVDAGAPDAGHGDGG